MHAGEDLELAAFVDQTWVEWFVQRGRWAQAVPVPRPAVDTEEEGAGGRDGQGVQLATNATDDVRVTVLEATAWRLRSIWTNQTTHDLPHEPPTGPTALFPLDALSASWL